MTSNPFPGRFFAFEGIDGCGKSTQCAMAGKLLLQNKLDVLVAKEPAKYLPSGKLIYGLLFGRDSVKFSDMTPRQRQRHYYINRIQHYFQLVIPALEAGTNLLTDRCLASITLDVEKLVDLDILLEDEESYFRMSEVPFIWPDKIIIYDLPPEEAVVRLNQKDERRRDFFEQPDRIKRNRDTYLEFASRFPNCCRVVDGTGNADEVFARTTRVLREEFVIG